MKTQEIASAIADETYLLIKKGKILAATDLLVGKLDQLLSDHDFRFAGTLLSKLDCDKLPLPVLTGVLWVTSHSKRELGLKRESFFDRSMISLRNIWGYSEERISSISRRLR